MSEPSWRDCIKNVNNLKFAKQLYRKKIEKKKYRYFVCPFQVFTLHSSTLCKILRKKKCKKKKKCGKYSMTFQNFCKQKNN